MAYQQVDTLTARQEEQLCELYQGEVWSRGRRIDEVRSAVRHSDIIVALLDGDDLVAFARVLTDYHFKAFIFDVIVAAKYRGEGLGRAVVEGILGHPDLQSVFHFELYCRPNMIPFYERWGFTAELGDIKLMRLVLCSNGPTPPA